MERTFICVKWGDKYSADDVNSLYRMVEKNTSLPFSFMCLTDDPTNVDTMCALLPDLPLTKWWWKLFMFKDNLFSNNVNIYFDLDVVIKGNIDGIRASERLKIIDRSFNPKTQFWEYEPFHTSAFCYYNSSILVWKNNTKQFIWDKFIKRPQYYMDLYRGIDGFLAQEFDNSLFEPINENLFYFLFNQPSVDGSEYTTTIDGIPASDLDRPICIGRGSDFEVMKKYYKYFR